MKIQSLAAFFALLTGPLLVKAQALYEVPLVEKVKNASLIVEGKVEQQVAFWNDQHTMIFTCNKIKVYKVFGGTLAGETIEVLTQGGSIGNDNIEVSELLDLQPETVGMFFCQPNQVNLRSPDTKTVLYDVYGSAQGCYKYDTRNMSASAPFQQFASITNGLYRAVTGITGRSFVDKQPGISFGNPPAATGAGLMAVTTFSPKVVNAGALLQTDSNLLTITGSGFGTASGNAAILFDNADDGAGGTPYVVAYNNNLVTSWTSTEIKVKVPAKAGNGNFTVRTSTGTTYTSPEKLVVNYAINTPIFTNNTAIQTNLMSTNGLGGYDVVYSTSTLGGGRNLATAAEKVTFQRALTTWKEGIGFNIREAGNTTNQVVTGSDNINTIMLDNTNTTLPVLPAGTLAITYSHNTTCLDNAGQFTNPAVKTGFDMIIRNAGVSAGTYNFTVGPCPPSTFVSESDLETIILHELGHVVNLAHIIDTYQGTQLPFVNPSKLMNYAIVNGVKRSSLDREAKTGGDYAIKNKSLTFASCSYRIPMTVLATIIEGKDECPLVFPTVATQNGTQLTFDLVHATSNSKVDPQYTALKCTGQGTGVTNTAFTVIKTNSQTSGVVSLSVSGYATVPAEQISCSGAGVELSVYQVNSCPDGQNFPAPVACRTFNADGVLTNLNLLANTTYLLVLDGIDNTKASFAITMNGTLLPIKIKNFYGDLAGTTNHVAWEFDELANISQVYLERSANGADFEEIKNWTGTEFRLNGGYDDGTAPATSYYRLRFVTTDGRVEYSNIINLVRKGAGVWKLYPNPVRNAIILNAANITPGRYTTRVYNSAGALVSTGKTDVAATAQNITIPATSLANGMYRVVVFDESERRIFQGNVSVLK